MLQNALMACLERIVKKRVIVKIMMSATGYMAHVQLEFAVLVMKRKIHLVKQVSYD